MTTFLTIAGPVIAIYALGAAFLYFKQDDLLFYRVVNDPLVAKEFASRRVTIATQDVTVEGWLRENPEAPNDLFILYFGGNAEDVLYTLSTSERLHAKRFLATNYRGYGGTGGMPSQRALFDDALAVYDYALSIPGASKENIILMGRSLGSGVATFVAAQREVRGVILVTPYDSIAAVAQAHYPYFPVSWLLKNRFPSIDWASSVKSPVLMLSAAQDEVIPAVHSRRLFDAWSGLKVRREIPGVGHNDIDLHPQYFESINEFLDDRAHAGPSS